MNIIEMRQGKGEKPPYIECVHPYLERWVFRYDIAPIDGTDSDTEYSWQEVWVSPRPTIEEIHTFLIQKSKEEEQSVMNAGFVWEGMRIKMDDENQANFKQQFDLQLADIFPIDAKYFFGEQSEIVYAFESKEKLQEWVLAMAMFKAQTKEAYIVKRNSINLEDYSL